MKAPNFKLSSTSGKTVELNKVKSKFIIIYFYPKDNTSGCTIETNDFNKLLNKFEFCLLTFKNVGSFLNCTNPTAPFNSFGLRLYPGRINLN